ncbi:uncharacterized protein LOC108104690 [Drosophila eugracilis]|uniref:uncharacterized protein LOC108104690 n=1 Tax=Drosophila eugracilis TaxID=29029 RepID=UPI0007E84163|nr:uncharacterized protein LOC108104690 [Drosophila eugracilis]
MNLILVFAMVLQLVLASSIKEKSIFDGIHLVMERSSGDVVHYRPARGVLQDEAVSATINGNTHRTRNNRKSNKSQEHFQQVSGPKPGSRKILTAESGSEASQLSQPNHKQGHKNPDRQQRQGSKQQHVHGQHHGGKKTGPKAKTSENGSTCRYAKSAWSNCDDKTNLRSRVLSLRKGEQNCLPTRTIQKKCKKGCRYEKGTWSQCVDGQMTRKDKLQAEPAGGSDQSCNPVRTVNKNCKANDNASGGKQHGQNRGTKERKQKKSAGRISSHDP